MDGLGQLTGAGIPVEIDGKEFILEPMGLEDFGIIENHLRSRLPNVIKLATEAAVGLPEDQRKHLLDQAFAEARRMHTIPPEQVIDFMENTLEGVALSIGICLERRYPGEFPLSRMYRVIRQWAELAPERLAEIKARRNMISGVGPEGESVGQVK